MLASKRLRSVTRSLRTSMGRLLEKRELRSRFASRTQKIRKSSSRKPPQNVNSRLPSTTQLSMAQCLPTRFHRQALQLFRARYRVELRWVMPSGETTSLCLQRKNSKSLFLRVELTMIRRVPDYPRASIGYSTQAMYTMAGMKPFSENTPLSRTRYSARIPIESPGAAVGSKLTAGLKNETENGGPLCKGEATVFVEKIRLSPSKSAS